MRIKIIGSSSKGNCYILQDSKGYNLIIEAGIKWQEIQKNLDFHIDKVVGCAISHSHKDHALEVKKILSNGIEVYAPEDVFQKAHVVFRTWCRPTQPMKWYRLGEYKLLSFPVQHDVPCNGYIIDHPEMGRLMFLTDTMYTEYVFPRINHFLIEANYDDTTLQENIDNGITPALMKKRLLNSHMELQTTKQLLQANDLSEAQTILLLHLSGSNSNPEEFIKQITAISGLPVQIATEHTEVDLTLKV